MSNYDPTDLRGQAESREQAEARARILRETEMADVRWLMNNPRGRRFVWRQLGLASIYSDGFDRNAMEMARLAGRRAIGLQLLDDVQKACPELIPVMEKEGREKEQQDGKREGGPKSK